jgi:hypothetical protein
MSQTTRLILGGAALAASFSLTADALAQQGPRTVVESSALTTPEDQLRFGRASVDKLVEAERRVGKLQEQAQKTGDDEQVQCVANVMSTVQGVRQVGELQLEGLRDAISASASDPNASATAERIVRLMVVLDTKASVFVAQAEACLGEDGVNNKSNSSVESNASALADGGDTNQLLDPDSLVDVEGPDMSPLD